MKLTEFYDKDASLQDRNEFIPNHSQSAILVQAKMADTPTVAFGFTQGDERLHASAEILNDLGYVVYGKGELSLTDRGEELMKKVALIDETGELTQEASELLAQGGTELPQEAPTTDMP